MHSKICMPCEHATKALAGTGVLHVQGLQNASLSSVQLAFTSLIPLDLGTRGSPLTSFFLDQGILKPISIAEDCLAFSAAAEAGNSGGGGGSGSGGSGDTLSGLSGFSLSTLSRQCVNGSTARVDGNSVAAINNRLWCMNLDLAGRAAVRSVAAHVSVVGTHCQCLYHVHTCSPPGCCGSDSTQHGTLAGLRSASNFYALLQDKSDASCATACNLDDTSLTRTSSCIDPTNGVAGAVDWKDSKGGVLNADVWYNDRDSDSEALQPPLRRLQKPIDRVVNSWLQEWLGVFERKDKTFMLNAKARALISTACAFATHHQLQICLMRRSTLVLAMQAVRQLRSAPTAEEQQCSRGLPAGGGYNARLLGFTDMPKPSSKLRVDISSLVGSVVFLWLVQVPLPLSLGLLVYEKEKRLRLMMRMHGLNNGVYIAVTYLYLLLLYIVYAAVMLIIGAAVGLGFFRTNSAGVLQQHAKQLVSLLALGLLAS